MDRGASRIADLPSGSALARLQQFTTVGLVTAALAWLIWWLSHGCVLWAVAGSTLIVFGYALVLALEIAIQWRVNRDDPAPRAGLADLLRAWWAEVRAAPTVFCWRQPFRSRRWADHLPPDAAGRRGLLLVHGFVCNRGLWNPWFPRLRQQGVPHVAVNLEPVFGSIDAYVGALDDAVRRLEQATGLAPVIVAHSMGGLAVRRWWSEQGDETRVWRAVTLGTPHHGTWLARFAVSANARQMRERSGWLQGLAAREPPGRHARFTCFYSHGDNIVFPASNATLEGADNRHLVGVAHVHMADRPEPFDEVMRWLLDARPG